MKMRKQGVIRSQEYKKERKGDFRGNTSPRQRAAALCTSACVTFATVRAIPPYRRVTCGDHKLLDTFVCVLPARQRRQNTHKRVQKDSLRRSRNLYGGIAPTVCETLDLLSTTIDSNICILVYCLCHELIIFFVCNECKLMRFGKIVEEKNYGAAEPINYYTYRYCLSLSS